MHPLPAKLKRTFIVFAAALGTILVLWWSLWAIGAAQYRNFVDHWLQAHRAQGYLVTFDDRETIGFPRHITLHFTNFVLQNPDGVKVHANDVSLSSFPWNWSHFDAKLKHGFELTIPFADTRALLITTDKTARNHTDLADNGDWTFINLELEDARALWNAQPFFGAGLFAIALKRPDQPPRDHRDTGLTFNALVNDLALPAEFAGPFGSTAAKVEISMRVMGPPPDPRKRDSVAAWNHDNGTVEFDKFYLEWGPLILATKGTLGLDDDLQPEGAFSAQIGNHLEVLKTLMAHDYIPTHQSGMLDSALKLFTKETTVAGKPGIEAPIAVQLGGLFLGPVRIYGFSEIEWAQDQPPPTTTPASPAQ